MLLLSCASILAQDLKSGPYKLPYKNTYVKSIFVSENEFRKSCHLRNGPDTRMPSTCIGMPGKSQ